MRALASAAALVLLVAACADDGPERLARTASPSDLEALADGGLLVAERATGRIVRVDARDELDVLATLDVVAEPGQRGPLGIVARGDDVFAASTRAGDGRLVVTDVTDTPPLVVWEGPPSADLANGGRLALREDDLVLAPAAPSGKLLLLDPDGAPTQRPRLLSAGWSNPFAFTVAGDAVWVADNAPGRRPERWARGETPAPTQVVELSGTSAPTGILAEDGALLVCGYVSEEVRRYELGHDDFQVVAGGCRYDLARLADGRLVLADDAGVVVAA